MGFSAVFAIVAVATTAVQMDAQRSAANKQEDAAKLQQRAQAEQKASNSQAAANEQRQQIREERVRRAKIMQASQNSGTEGSSGELGAIGSLQTQLSTNIGTNLGRIQSANTISDLQQQAANLQFDASKDLQRAQQAQQIFQIGASIFGGFQSAKLAGLKANAPQVQPPQ